MPGENVKITIQRLNIHRMVHYRLRAIDQHFRAILMRQRDHFRKRVFRSQHVRHMRDSQQSGTLIKQRRERIQLQRAVRIERNDAQFRPCTRAQHLPGDNIGVVLHLADDDVIASPNILRPPAVGNKVDALCRPAHEHQLFR